jgi:hypothetical protein
MRPARHRSIPTALIILGVLAGTAASGQSSFELPPLSDNAALQYWQAVATLPALDASQEKMLQNWSTTPLGVSTSKLLDQCQTSLAYMRRAATMRECDWGLDYNEGVSLHLPHLAKGRLLARIAMLDARRALAAGNIDKTGEDMGIAVTLARQLGRDYTLVSMLVCYAIEGMVIDTIAPHVPELGIPYDDAARAFAALPPAPSLEHATQCEKRMASTIVQQLRAAEEKQTGSWRETWLAILGPDADESLKKAQSFEQVITQLEAFQSVYDELEALVALPPAEFDAKFPAFVKKAGAANPMAKLLLPAMDKDIETQRRSDVRMAMLMAGIAVVERGPEKIADFKDPFGDGPFGYKKLKTGFELSSKLMHDGKPVTLMVGPQEE